MEEKNNNLKAVAESPDELVVENHIVLFGGRDLTGFAYGKNQNGTEGEYFTKATDLESDYTKSGYLHVDFEHGRDPDEIGNDKHSVLGFVNWKSARYTDEGVIVQRVLNRRHKYMRWLEPLIKAGVVGNSSEAVPTQIEKTQDGEIKRWGLRRDTLTVTPMEPRMVTHNLVAVKSLIEDFPQYKEIFKSIELQETNVMEKEIDVKSIVEAEVKAALDAKAAADKVEAERLAAIKKAEEEGYNKAIEELKTRKAPAYNRITETGFSEEKDAVPAFKHWLKTGQVNDGLIRPDATMESIPEGKAAWNVTTGASGGYLVPDPLYTQIVAKRNLASWVRQAPVQKFSTPADHLLVPVEDTSHTAFVKTAEAAAYDENEGTVAQKDLILYKYTKMQKVNEEFISYQGTNFDSWLAEALGRAEAVTENTIYTDGTGTSEPQGVLVGATNSSLTLAAVDAITAPEIAGLIGKLGAGYNVPSECGFLMANATKWYLKGVVNAGPYAFATPAGGPDLFGYNAYVSDDMAPYTTESDKPVLFGNFSFYGVVEKPGMLVQRNPYLYMATGQIGIFASIFRGGAVLQAEAFYYINSHA